jgi:hypothetical protein
MKASRQAVLERIAFLILHPGVPQWETAKIALEEEAQLADVVEAKTLEEALPVVLAVANLGDSPEAVRAFKEWVSSGGYGPYGVPDKADEWLFRFRDQLRKLWQHAEAEHLQHKQLDRQQVNAILGEWLKARREDRGDDQGVYFDPGEWAIFHNAGKFIPKQSNIRAIAARVVIYNAKRLAQCVNPDCKRFFLKDRKTQIICAEEGCERYANKERNKAWRAKKSKLTRIAIKKESRGR